MSRFRQVAANSAGRDLAVGDIHGHFPRLEQCLQAVGFDTKVDRLFSVGDLVDRGPNSEACLWWLSQPWFHAVQGNHEALAISYLHGGRLDLDMYRAAGGGWFMDMPNEQQAVFVERFMQLPLAMEVQTESGLIGLLHADTPFNQWQALRDSLLFDDDPTVRQVCQWSRQRLKDGNDEVVHGVRALLVGHTPVLQAKQLGNVWHLDTGGWATGHFSLMDLASLQLISATADESKAPGPAG
ncbi:metallophosphoesterase [Pseudomonas promysalinigenes]|uniref:metallophosphoesterase n=1 Tax=Pseudomonas promysalinigenes TaxID=485898 RepID=UPI0039174545